MLGGAGGEAIAAPTPAATVRKCRRVGSTGVFVGGVLSTRAASSMGHSLLGVRPVAVLLAPRRAAWFTSEFKVYPIMRTSRKKGIPKRRGRPATGKDPMLSARVPASVFAQVETWAQQHDATRSEAIRRLVELGLKAKGK